MMKIYKKYLIVFVTLLCLFGVTFYSRTVKAESGWDSSYDSGSSWDSGSDWSSSWDDDDWSYSGGGVSLSFGEFVFVMIVIIVIVVITSRKKNNSISSSNIQNGNKSYNYHELSDEEINKLDSTLNKDDMGRLAFDIYKNIQDAWMNFDYDTLKKYTSDELFNMYESQLKVLKAKKQKNIMSDIEFRSAKIIDITIENGVEKVKMYLNTITKDYVVDANNNVVRGSDKFRNDMEYFITLNRNINKENIKNCPSCGAPIDIVSGGKCPYCDSVIVNNNTEFVMSKKECIGQRRV